jgi:pimeloyl-ACP methyl ester carboxylesterase
VTALERLPIAHVHTTRGTFAYVEGNPEGQSTAIFLHGNWSTHLWWYDVMRALPKDYRLIAYDLRGRGATQASDNAYTIEEHAHDLLAMTNALSLGSVHVVGHSLGAAVAMQAALATEARVLSLALLAPSWIDGLPALYNVPSAQHALEEASTLDRALRSLSPRAQHDRAVWQTAIAEGAGQRRLASELNLAALTSWRPGDGLRAIKRPAMIVVGDEDRLTGLPVAERVAEVLRGQLRVVHQAGHCLPLEVGAEVAGILAGFWQGLEVVVV